MPDEKSDNQNDKPNITINEGGQFTFNGNATGAFGPNAVYNEINSFDTQSKLGPSIIAPSSNDAPQNGVFISYSRQDSDKVASAVQRLYDKNITLWWDRANIPPGANWRDEIQYALEKSDAGVLFVSQASLDSKIVRDEYRYFLNSGKQLIPVLCELVSLPAELQNINYVVYQDFERVILMLADHQAKG